MTDEPGGSRQNLQTEQLKSIVAKSVFSESLVTLFRPLTLGLIEVSIWLP